MEPQTEGRRSVIVLGAVLLILIGVVLFLYNSDMLSGGDMTSDLPQEQQELPSPSVDKKTELYHDLEADMTAQPSVADEERVRIYQETEATQGAEQGAPPSESDRQKLLEGLE